MLRPLLWLQILLVVGGSWLVTPPAMAGHGHGWGQVTGYRPPSSYYNSVWNSWGPPMYRGFQGRPLYGTFSTGYASYHQSHHYGTGLHAPWGGYGASGFPRAMGHGYRSGSSSYFHAQ
jgi:hypothetical protein